jgi:LacI family transcriptional regulator
MERVTIAQVAAAAGVSAVTVSNVINGRPGASEKTRQVVMAAVQQLGYTPNLAARGLKGGRTSLVGVLALDLTNQYSLEIVRGIADELATVEMEVLISATYQDAGREADRVRFLTNGLVDGLLFIAPVLDEATLHVLRGSGRPAVVIDPRRFDVQIPRVVVDNYRGSRDATRHLIELGHRRIAYIGGDEDFESSAERRRGFLDAMNLAGVEVNPELMREVAYSYDGGTCAATELLVDPMPTAIVAAGDLMAFAAIDVARSRGLEIPLELSVVGFDDLPQARQSFPGLTTVRQPLHDMGVAAVRMLLAQLDGRPAVTDRMQFDASLIVRGSTTAPSASADASGVPVPAKGAA